MRLNLIPVSNKAHQDLASAVGWSNLHDLYTCSDDQSIHRWTARGEPQGKVCVLETYFADLHCSSVGAKKQQGTATDVIAVACTDGTLKLVGSNGRLDKTIDAHRGAVLSVRWSPDGAAIATSGEDGHVRIWSSAGMLRSTLVQADEPVYCVAWGGTDAGQVLFCSGCHVAVKPLQGVGGSNSSCSSTQLSWKAHDALVLKADWNATTNLIVTGGEDCKYKVWDAFGRLLYQSSPWEHSITSVAWSPDGSLFAAGSYNCITLCDRQGWSYCQVRPTSGSLLGLAWSPDGTALAACGGDGSLVLATLLDVSVGDGRVVAVLENEKTVTVSDLSLETRERLDFREPVVKMSLGCNHLVVCTASQCHVFSATNWNTPHIFDLKDPAQLVMLCGRGFAILGAGGGIQVFTYEGRQVCVVKPAGVQTEGISRQMISLSNDTLAVAAGSCVRCFDTAQGRPMGEAINHTLEVKAVALSQFGNAADRLLALLDANGDLHLARLLSSSSAASVKGALAVSQQQQQQLVKLATNITGPAVWHDTAPMLAALVDGQLVVWYHPGAAHVDRELLAASKHVQNDGSIGAGATLELFSGSSLRLRRRDGARVCASIPPQPAMLHELVRQGRWDKAVRLARFGNDSAVWACLAALAISAGELTTAEAAFAAIDAVDKLHFILHLRELAGVAAAGPAGDVVIAAELAVYRRQSDDAEAMLIQAGLVYRAIKMHVKLHNWQRALELAQKHDQHVHTVLMYRRRHLAAVGQQEVLPSFKALGAEAVDEAAVKERIRQDKSKEQQSRGSHAPAAGLGQNGTGLAAAGGHSKPRR